MKADEIRTYLKKWNQEDLLKLYTQTYRRVPKDVKEELDEIIQSGFKKEAPKVSKRQEKPNIAALRSEIEQFDRLARDGYYYQPNRTVSKKERANWRFTAKRMIKDACAFRPDDPEYDESNLLLCMLYDLLGYATGFYTFASQDPYHAVGYKSQAECFEMITDRVMRSHSDSQEPLRELIRCGCNGRNDYENLDEIIHRILLEDVVNDDMLDEMQALAEELFAPVKEEYDCSYRGQTHFMITEDEIITRDRHESLCWFLVCILLKRGMLRDAYDFAMKNGENQRKEVDFYILLTHYPLSDEDWIELYQMGLKDGIKPRDTLKEAYAKLTTT